MRLIDAEALDAAFTALRFNADGSLKHWGDRPDWCLYGNEVETLIKDAPTVEPKRGRWVKMTGMMPPEYHGHYECSVCNWHMKGIRNSWTREEDYAYCPHCGAKMDGGETDE